MITAICIAGAWLSLAIFVALVLGRAARRADEDEARLQDSIRRREALNRASRGIWTSKGDQTVEQFFRRRYG